MIKVNIWFYVEEGRGIFSSVEDVKVTKMMTKREIEAYVKNNIVYKNQLHRCYNTAYNMEERTFDIYMENLNH